MERNLCSLPTLLSDGPGCRVQLENGRRGGDACGVRRVCGVSFCSGSGVECDGSTGGDISGEIDGGGGGGCDGSSSSGVRLDEVGVGGAEEGGHGGGEDSWEGGGLAAEGRDVAASVGGNGFDLERGRGIILADGFGNSDSCKSRGDGNGGGSCAGEGDSWMGGRDLPNGAHAGCKWKGDRGGGPDGVIEIAARGRSGSDGGDKNHG